MAKEGECPFYNECGFVKYRRDLPFSQVVPLPPDGDCGKNPNTCPRLVSKQPLGFTLDYDTYGPQTQEEMDIALPAVIPSRDGKTNHRIIGGTDK